MKFIDIILQNSQAKEAKLYGPSRKASESPETGVVIQTPAAFHVIRDCATIANKYIPHYVFVLKAKFTRADVEEFVRNANSDIVLYQLLVLILEKIKKVLPQSSVNPVSSPSVNTAITNSDDPYGEYEFSSQPVTAPKSQDTVSLICDAFHVIN